MNNNPRLAGIASFLRRYYAEHKRISETGFVKASKGILSPKEAREIFEYLASIDESLALSTKRMFVWTVHQDHFTDHLIGKIADWVDLSKKLDTRQKKSKDYEDEDSTCKIINGTKAVDLSGFSTEDLAAELYKRGWTVTFGGIV